MDNRVEYEEAHGVGEMASVGESFATMAASGVQWLRTA